MFLIVKFFGKPSPQSHYRSDHSLRSRAFFETFTRNEWVYIGYLNSRKNNSAFSSRSTVKNIANTLIVFTAKFKCESAHQIEISVIYLSLQQTISKQRISFCKKWLSIPLTVLVELSMNSETALGSVPNAVSVINIHSFFTLAMKK